ncbi:MAG: hypothetical protein K6T76_12030 [Alicyclobacillus mali]|uniref:hypothetical protein n=1 Tax=Alicyclobacillus mali (ex Roth et al. 2021) TaxID=1123961 RepID=UPI001A8F9297|nr:hypothetical protein [Alicyclobacillus mali (ex Roth et al. 2021)]MCL6489646.1 hypothetical protein [Alicyclobacillus mali (ex Roth et al. 2021)]
MLNRWVRLLAITGMAVGAAAAALPGAIFAGEAPRAVPGAHPAAAEWQAASASPTVYGVRRFPYPYRAMLAISSDADSQTLRKFNLVHRFINTTQITALGRGLGLDFADSFFVYTANDQPHIVDEIGRVPLQREFSYFRGTGRVPYGAKAIHAYIRDGWIDTMHTYGDFSQVNQQTTRFRRHLAAQAVTALKANRDFVDVWTDHGNRSNVDNFGARGRGRFYAYQQGDLPGSPYYHTDLTIPYGIRFVWPDISSNAFSRPSVVFPLRLTDGRRVWGFWRYTNERYTPQGAVVWNWTPYGLDEQLSEAHLARLEADGGLAVVAQHLCGTPYPGVLPKDAVAALERLAQHERSGRLLVTRTSRLLHYNVTRDHLRYDVTHAFGRTYIHIRAVDDPVLGSHAPTLDEVRGVTFYTQNPRRTVLELGGRPVDPAMVVHNPSDGIHPSIGIRWFPKDTADHAINVAGVS